MTRTASRRPSPVWSASRRTSSITSSVLALLPERWTAKKGFSACMRYSTWMNTRRSSLNGTGWHPPAVCPQRTLLHQAPLSFRTGKQFRHGQKIRGCFFLQILAPGAQRPDAGRFSRYGKLPHRQYAHPVRGSGEGHQTIKRKITDLGPQKKIEEQKKAVRADTTWTLFQATLPPTAVEAKKSSCRSCKAATSVCSFLTFLGADTADNPQSLATTSSRRAPSRKSTTAS